MIVMVMDSNASKQCDHMVMLFVCYQAEFARHGGFAEQIPAVLAHQVAVDLSAHRRLVRRHQDLRQP